MHHGNYDKPNSKPILFCRSTKRPISPVPTSWPECEQKQWNFLWIISLPAIIIIIIIIYLPAKT